MTNLRHSGVMDESLGFGSRVGQSDWLREVPRLTAGSWLAVLRDMGLQYGKKRCRVLQAREGGPEVNFV